MHLTFCQESGPRFPSQERATERIQISSKNGLRAERGGLFFLLQLLSQLLDLPLKDMLERQFIFVVRQQDQSRNAVIREDILLITLVEESISEDTDKHSLRNAKLKSYVRSATSSARESGKSMSLLSASFACQYFAYIRRSPFVGSKNSLPNHSRFSLFLTR